MGRGLVVSLMPLWLARLARRARAEVDAKLGRCPRCFRLSFAGALFGWSSMAALGVAGAPPILVVAALGWSIAFSALWLSHMAVYGLRVLQDARHRVDEPQGPFGPYGMTRRRAFAVFGRSVQYAAMASIVGALAAVCGDTDYDPNPGTNRTNQNQQDRQIVCPCRRPYNVYNASFWRAGKYYAAGCYDRCYSTDCRAYNSC